MARFAIMNLAMDVMFFWNETWCDGHIDRDVGLFRNTFSASPVSPSQPQPAYYVLRTLSTIFENAYPQELTLLFSPSDMFASRSGSRSNNPLTPFIKGECAKPDDFVLREMECWTFGVKGGDRLVSISQSEVALDNSPEVVVDLSFPGNKFQRAVGIDVLNGEEQDLVLTVHDGSSKLAGLILRNYPLVHRLTP